MSVLSARRVARSVGALALLLTIGCTIEQGGIADRVPLDETSLPSSDDGTDGLAIDTALPEVGSDSGSISDFGADAADSMDASSDADADSGFGPGVLTFECESGTMFGGMSAVSDPAASGGLFAKVSSTTPSWTSGTTKPPTRVELHVDVPTAGAWYVWVREFTRDGDGDAMYVGFDPVALRRFYHLDWGKFRWVGADSGGTGARLVFGLTKGAHTMMLGPGEPGVGCDLVALTQNASWTPP